MVESFDSHMVFIGWEFRPSCQGVSFGVIVVELNGEEN